MGSAEMITDAVSVAIGRQRVRVLSGVRGVFVTCAAVVTTLAAVATAAHTWFA